MLGFSFWKRKPPSAGSPDQAGGVSLAVEAVEHLAGLLTRPLAVASQLAQVKTLPPAEQEAAVLPLLVTLEQHLVEHEPLKPYTPREVRRELREFFKERPLSLPLQLLIAEDWQRHLKLATLLAEALIRELVEFLGTVEVQRTMETELRGSMPVPAVKQNDRVNWQALETEMARQPEEEREIRIAACGSGLLAALFARLAAIAGRQEALRKTEALFRALEADYAFLPNFSFLLKLLPSGVQEVEKLAQLSREELEQALQKRTRELEVAREYTAILRSMSETLFVLTPEATIQNVNPATCELLGYAENELVGQPFGKVFEEEEEEEEEEEVHILFRGSGLEALVQQGAIRNLEMRFVSKSGERIPMLLSGATMCTESGELTGVVCVAWDLTERKRLERERQEIELKALAHSKMASLGEMASGMSHEINNPLGIISFVNQRLEAESIKPLEPEEKTEQLQIADRAIKRIAAIINHVSVFGRAESVEMQLVKPETVLEETLLLLSESLRLNNIELDKEIEEHLPQVHGNAHQLEQVLLNLFQNSMYALDGRRDGCISVSLYRENANPAQFVCLRFADNGPGIPPEVRERIFEPFFTTKDVGQGTGLGLSIVYGIVSDHGGEITCDSTVGQGTIFKIRLPEAKS